jgi:two-component system, OmpR family, response regulator RegX3
MVDAKMCLSLLRHGTFDSRLPLSHSTSSLPMWYRAAKERDMQRQRIVVAESDVLAVRMLGYVLADEGYQVDIAHSGAGAIGQIVGRETALVLLDTQLPDIDSGQFLRELRERRFDGPVIALSQRNDLGHKLDMFRAGVDDFLSKPFEPLELLVRIKAVIRRYDVGDRQPLETIIRVNDSELDLGALSYSSNAVMSTFLAPTEMRVLECLMRSAQTIISREALIERVWGYNFYGDTNRVDVYIRRVRRRIEANPERPLYLHTVRGLGYVFRPESGERSQIGGPPLALAQPVECELVA